ncbi:alpha/beta fold hydrolase [Pelomonas sp. KK5]|uniref:alpha/beta fold hydrolase n=1 Tax=Pelomonas sp. KK5 TaxID=1855730 RepID=UPI001E32C90B|nr:alpha/beta fold hydrolase [Pelomonas sp. KK5]
MTEIHREVAGRDGGKAPVVLSHALGLDVSMWDALAAKLAAAGHPVLRYDHRGHGRSGVPAGPYTMDDLVADAAEVIRDWGVGPVVWIGLSMGGMVGQGMAIHHPELLRGLVLANTTAQYPPAAQSGWAERIAKVEAGGLAAIVETVLERYLNASFRAANPGVVDALRRKVLSVDPRGYVGCCHAVSKVNWLDRLHEIRRLSTLVIAGRLDAGTPVAMAEAIHHRVAGSQLTVLEDASHLSVVEQPARFEEVVTGFLAGC